MNRSRPLLISICEVQNFLQIKANKSTQSKLPNYYDTLQVHPDCTQSDVKSAYYKLSKKYHPDINNSGEAKKKFQNISDAYNTLSNFSKRKQYDRDLIALGQKARSRPVYSMKEDPVAAFYKSRLAEHDHINTAANEKIYNFDAWTSAHYGKSFTRSLRYKNNKILRETLDADYEKERAQAVAASWLLISVCIFTILSLLLQMYLNHRALDKNLLDNKKGKKT